MLKNKPCPKYQINHKRNLFGEYIYPWFYIIFTTFCPTIHSIFSLCSVYVHPVCMREQNKPEWNKIRKILRRNEDTEQSFFVRTKIQKLATNQRSGNFVPIFVLYLCKCFVSLNRWDYINNQKCSQSFSDFISLYFSQNNDQISSPPPHSKPKEGVRLHYLCNAL